MVTIYLIRSNEDWQDDAGNPIDQWWSNEGGWSDLSDAIVFTEAEQAEAYLPYNGDWVKFTSEV